MAEPTSSAASAGIAFGAVWITTMLPGVNGDALVGSFAGAALFALHVKDVSIIKRLIYMLISILIGYLGADEVLRQTWLESYTLAAFGLSAVIVTLALATIDRIQEFDLTRFLKRR